MAMHRWPSELSSLVMKFSVCWTQKERMGVGLDKLCQHNFENNRYSLEYENNAGIIGKAFCVIIT